MPILYAYKDLTGYYAKACIQGAVVTFQLTEAGSHALAGAGVKPGDRFPHSILLDLIRRGEAFTGGSGAGLPPEDPDQLWIVFGPDEDLDSHLPKCEETGSAIDLHLVVVEEDGQPRARVLGHDPRFILRKSTTLSLPLAAVTLELLQQLEAVRKLPPKSEAVEHLRTWLREDRRKDWEKLQQLNRRHQTDLGLEGDQEGTLF